MIYQTAYTDENGKIGGLVEISMVIPEEMPHYDRADDIIKTHHRALFCV